jgi:hypothetical protein
MCNDGIARLFILVMVLAWTESRIVAAAPPTCHECTLHDVLSGGKDAILVMEISDKGVCRIAAEVADQPMVECHIKQHCLELADGRLRGKLQLVLGQCEEELELDLSLDQGGTYSLLYGMRRVEGAVRIKPPEDPDSRQWTCWLDAAMGANASLAVPLNIDRAAKSIEALPATGYNKAKHTVDATKLQFDGTRLAGELAITIMPDGWLPPDRQPMPGVVRLEASLEENQRGGRYTGTFGAAKQRSGKIDIRPTSRERLQKLLFPVLPPWAPWRAYLVLASPVARKGGQLVLSDPRTDIPFDPLKFDPATYRHSPLPPGEWFRPDFDDYHWPRYQTDLPDYLGHCRVGRGAPTPAVLYLRSCFGIAEPANVKDLKLTLAFIGGVVVYVNGQEIGRAYLPDGPLHPWTPAEDYPLEAYVTEDGITPLPPPVLTGSPEPKWSARYDMRVRLVTLDVPSGVLVKGRNVLAIALHRAAIAGPLAAEGWSHVGFQLARLDSASGEGVISYPEALRGPRVWNAATVEQITETLSSDPLVQRTRPGSHRWSPVKGVQCGNPFEPLRPVRLLGPRNGVCSGQVVLSDPAVLQNVSAAITDLRGPSGAVIPAAAVQIRYAVQQGWIHYCDALMPTPPAHAKTVPVWMIVSVPRDAPPGRYEGTLALQANGQSFAVPVQMQVSAVVVPNARDFTSQVALGESPESVALEYAVRCWSDEHFRLLEKSLEMLGQVGNDVVHVPVILGTHSAYAVDWVARTDVSRPGPARRVPLVRWVQRGEKLVPEFSLLEKFLDVYAKYCAPPQALVLYVWDASSAKEVADAYEGRRRPTRAYTPHSRLMVSLWNPTTDKTTDIPAPAFIEPGAEEFWKPMFDGVREIVRRRGWPPQCLMAGLGGDIRPGQRTGELLRQWAPEVRWNLLSHFSGDPGPSDGKLIVTGGLEVGLKEWPAAGCLPVPTLEARLLQPTAYLELPTFRWSHAENSPPMLFRTLPLCWGAFTRLGLDFWPGRGGPRYTSWFSHVNHLSVPGPDGAAPTVRFQMLREGTQEHEIRANIIRAYASLPPEKQAPWRELIGELNMRLSWATPYLSQMELAYNWDDYLARLHAAAATLQSR